MNIQLKAKSRELTGKKVNQLREDGHVPAVLYGKGFENQNLELGLVNFEKIYDRAGTNTIIDLTIDDQDSVKILIADLQRDPVKGFISHVDLKKIRMDEKITAQVEIELTGEALAVKELDGILVHALSELEIRCLPGDLIHGLKVSVDGLKTFDDTITVADLDIPETVELIGHEPEDVVATVAPPKVEEEPVVVEAEGEEGAKDEEGAESDGANSEDKNKEDETAKEEASK